MPAITASVEHALRSDVRPSASRSIPARPEQRHVRQFQALGGGQGGRPGGRDLVYPRGENLSKEGKRPSTFVPTRPRSRASFTWSKSSSPPEQEAARKVYEKEKVAIAQPAERIRHIVQSAFDGRRIVIFSARHER